MKTKIISSLCFLIAVMFWLSSSSRALAATTSATNDVDYWTCGMHPSVHSKTPGKCPICGMDLVPVVSQKKDASRSLNTGQQADVQATFRQSRASKELSAEGDNIILSKLGEFIVPVQRQQQIGVTYAEVRRRRV